MGKKITIKQNDFSHGMQSDTRNKNLVGQTQVFGASKLKHFDIYDKGKLKPISSFERFNTDNEINYGINVVGGKEGSTIYGLGKAISNWYAIGWQYSIQLDASFTTSTGDYIAVDLSNLSNNFWDNVNDDGSDVRITPTSSSQPIKTIVVDFDSISKTGWAIARSSDIDDVYIYFGNPNATNENDYSNLFDLVADNFYTLDNTLQDATSTGTIFNLTGTPVYGTSPIGTGATTLSNLTTGDSGISYGDETSISFFLKIDSLPASETLLLDFEDQTSEIHLRSDGKLRFNIDLDNAGSPGFIDEISSNSISTGNWNYISITSDSTDGLKVYINGVSWFTFSYSNDLDSASGGLRIHGIGQTVHYSFISWLRGQAKSNDTLVAEGKMLTDSSFWTENSLVDIADITATFSGVAIYEKDINGTEWANSIYNGFAIKDPSNSFTPIPSFIDKDDDNGFFFLTNSNLDLIGTTYGGRAGYGDNIIDANNTALSIRRQGELLNTIEQAVDKEFYVTKSGALDVFAPIPKAFKYVDLENTEQSTVYDIGWTDSVYDSFPRLSNVCRYGYGLAMTGTRNSKSSIEIWDLINLDPEHVVEIGTGNSKIIANIKGSLVAVVDNYLQDEGLSRGKPTLDFRLWQGGESTKTIQSFDFDNVDTVYPNNWEYAIDNRRSDLHNASVFVAEPATDWKGMWAIGSGDTGTLGVSILYDTETLGRIDTHHSIGNNLIVIKNDGAIYKLNDDGDYNQTSTFESMVIDAGLSGIKKDINAIEIVLDKDLPDGQTVTVYYKVDIGDNAGTWQTVGTCDAKVTEFTLANGEAFDNFNEMELKIESTGGDAIINEYSIVVEYEQEVV